MKYSFENFLESKILSEIINNRSISHNGNWSEDGKSYYFSLPNSSERCEEWNGHCWGVFFRNSLGGVNISFLHQKTKDDDRKSKDDFMTLLGIIFSKIEEYINEHDPNSLSWMPAYKTDIDAANPEARDKIYFLMMARELFPRYIPWQDNLWYKREYYDNWAKSQGLPLFDPLKYVGTSGARKWLNMVEEIQAKNHHSSAGS